MDAPALEAARVIRSGGVVAYPTDTLWGLGAGLSHPAAVERVFELKRRPKTEPLSIAVASVEEISTYAVVTPLARRLFALLPGALTLILERRASVPEAVTGGRADVGVRVPAHADCEAFLRAAGAVTTTSANLHGGAEPRTLADVRQTFGDRVDYYLPANMPPIGAASTIVDARSDSPRIVRLGALRESRIRQIVG